MLWIERDSIHDWLSEMGGAVKSVRSLQVWNVWDHDVPRYLANGGSDLGFRSAMDCLLCFCNLEEIRFVFEERFESDPVSRGIAMEAIRAGFVRYFELHAEAFKGGKIPRVVVEELKAVKVEMESGMLGGVEKRCG